MTVVPQPFPEMIDERVRIQSSPLNLFGFFSENSAQRRTFGRIGHTAEGRGFGPQFM